jgi:PAB-dependent poly(A)-specific ribonuclease subunit 2
MPYYNEPLLSNFPPSDYAHVTSPFFNPPEPIPASVMEGIKVVDFVGYATMPKELRGKRYQRIARTGAGKRATSGRGGTGRRESTPRFRSDKDRKEKGATAPEVEEEVSHDEYSQLISDASGRDTQILPQSGNQVLKVRNRRL